MQTLLVVVVCVVACIFLLMQWLIAWRYLLYPSIRSRMRQDLQSKSQFVQVADTLAIVIGFIIVNAIIAAVIWRIVIGPIKPIHEW
jgi:hypothetical protein